MRKAWQTRTFSRVELLMEDFKLVRKTGCGNSTEVTNGMPKDGKDNKCGAAIELKNKMLTTGKDLYSECQLQCR